MNTDQIAVRFWAKVSKKGEDECWLWTGSKRRRGYGHMRDDNGRKGKHLRAHYVSWLIHNGEVPLGLFVLHRCDNPSCVNPRHLFIGTNSDNVQDCIRKGRYNNGRWTEEQRKQYRERVLV